VVDQPEPASAETETGDRPEIKVPRAGGRAARKVWLHHLPYGRSRGSQNEGGGAGTAQTKLTEQEVVQTIVNGRAGKACPPSRE
jgi:hypothetical protein